MMTRRRISILEALGGIALFTLTFGPLFRLTLDGTAVSYPPQIRTVPGLRELTGLMTIVVPLVAQATYWLLFVPVLRRLQGPRSW